MAEINVAVIGFGLAGRVFHAPFVNAVPGLKRDAIVQRKGDEAQKAYPNARILRSFDDAINDSSIDLIEADNRFQSLIQAISSPLKQLIDLVSPAEDGFKAGLFEDELDGVRAEGVIEGDSGNSV